MEAATLYKLNQAELAYRRLAKHPDQQAEEIAKHYVSNADIALNLRKLCELRRQTVQEEGGNLDDMIAYCVKQIKNNHRMDFGIELEWRP